MANQFTKAKAEGETTEDSKKASLTGERKFETAVCSRLDAIEAQLAAIAEYVSTEAELKSASELRVLVEKALSGHVQQKLTHNNRSFVKETVLKFEREKQLAPESIVRLREIVAKAIATK